MLYRSSVISVTENKLQLRQMTSSVWFALITILLLLRLRRDSLESIVTQRFLRIVHKLKKNIVHYLEIYLVINKITSSAMYSGVYQLNMLFYLIRIIMRKYFWTKLLQNYTQQQFTQTKLSLTEWHQPACFLGNSYSISRKK